MNTTELLSAIDTEIATLRQARALLIGDDGHRAAPGPKLAKRIMSAEGRARIAAAQRKRWEAQKGTAKKTA